MTWSSNRSTGIKKTDLVTEILFSFLFFSSHISPHSTTTLLFTHLVTFLLSPRTPPITYYNVFLSLPYQRIVFVSILPTRFLIPYHTRSHLYHEGAFTSILSPPTQEKIFFFSFFFLLILIIFQSYVFTLWYDPSTNLIQICESKGPRCHILLQHNIVIGMEFNSFSTF